MALKNICGSCLTMIAYALKKLNGCIFEAGFYLIILVQSNSISISLWTKRNASQGKKIDFTPKQSNILYVYFDSTSAAH